MFFIYYIFCRKQCWRLISTAWGARRSWWKRLAKSKVLIYNNIIDQKPYIYMHVASYKRNRPFCDRICERLLHGFCNRAYAVANRVSVCVCVIAMLTIFYKRYILPRDFPKALIHPHVWKVLVNTNVNYRFILEFDCRNWPDCHK